MVGREPGDRLGRIGGRDDSWARALCAAARSLRDHPRRHDLAGITLYSDGSLPFDSGFETGGQTALEPERCRAFRRAPTCKIRSNPK